MTSRLVIAASVALLSAALVADAAPFLHRRDHLLGNVSPSDPQPSGVDGPHDHAHEKPTVVPTASVLPSIGSGVDGPHDHAHEKPTVVPTASVLPSIGVDEHRPDHGAHDHPVPEGIPHPHDQAQEQSTNAPAPSARPPIGDDELQPTRVPLSTLTPSKPVGHEDEDRPVRFFFPSMGRFFHRFGKPPMRDEEPIEVMIFRLNEEDRGEDGEDRDASFLDVMRDDEFLMADREDENAEERESPEHDRQVAPMMASHRRHRPGDSAGSQQQRRHHHVSVGAARLDQ